MFIEINKHILTSLDVDASVKFLDLHATMCCCTDVTGSMSLQLMHSTCGDSLGSSQLLSSY